MWYKIPITYVDFATGVSNRNNADLLLDLPQVCLEDAKNNLFVKDLVRHPVIKSIYGDKESYLKAPECILQSCDQNYDVSSLYEVQVRYQRDPALIANMGHSFVFSVYIDSHEHSVVGLPKDFEFTCRADYDFYYETFLNDLLVDTGVWGPVEFEDGQIIKVFTGCGFEIAKVFHGVGGELMARILPPSSGEIGINHLTLSCIRSVDLTNDVLVALSTRFVAGCIAGHNTYWYEITLMDSQATIIKFSRTRFGQFCLLVEEKRYSGQEQYKIIPFVGLDGLQRVIKEQYDISFCPSDEVLQKIASIVKSSYPSQQLMKGLNRIIESYGANADYDSVLADVCEQYGISSSDAALYLSGFKLRGYFS